MTLSRAKRVDHRQEAEAGDLALGRLDAVGIEDALAEELVAAADAEDGRRRRGARDERTGEAAGAQPAEIGDGGLGAGHDHERGAARDRRAARPSARARKARA